MTALLLWKTDSLETSVLTGLQQWNSNPKILPVKRLFQSGYRRSITTKSSNQRSLQGDGHPPSATIEPERVQG